MKSKQLSGLVSKNNVFYVVNRGEATTWVKLVALIFRLVYHAREPASRCSWQQETLIECRIDIKTLHVTYSLR